MIYDAEVETAMQGIRSLFLHDIFWVVSMSLFVAVALIIAYNILVVRNNKYTLTLLGIYGGLFILIEILKRVIERVRPNGELLSFPSRHAAFAFLIAVTLPAKGWERVMLYIWAISVAFSRLILANHWLSDVVFGAGIGIAAGLVFRKITKKNTL